MADDSKKYVIDASAVLAFLLPDEIYKKKARLAFADYSSGKTAFIAPLLLYYEVANSLKTAVMRKRVSLLKAKLLLQYFIKLKISTFDDKKQFSNTLRLAAKYNLSAYDASYLVLAKEEKCKLLTADKRLFNKLKKGFPAIKLL